MLKVNSLVGFANNPAVTVPLAVTNTAVTANASSTSLAVNLPSGIVAGQLLLAFSSSATASRALTVPSGWTKLTEATANFTATNTISYKWTDGTEGATATFTVGTAVPLSTICLLISGAQNAAPEFDLFTGTSSTPDPIVISPTWGSTKQTLVIPMYFSDTGNTSSYPTGYPDSRVTVSNVQGNTPSVGCASKVAIVTTDNPGTFGMSGSSSWRSYTIAVRAA